MADVEVPFNDLVAQYATIREEIDAAIRAVVRSAAFIRGAEVDAFEEAFGDYCGAEAVGVGNGTDAIELALRSLGVGRDDEVITTAHTFIATVEPIVLLGATPVLVDCRPDTCNLDADQLERAITPRTRAIIPVHLYGQPADMNAVGDVARRHGLPVVEDAAQAHGALLDGRRAGALGDVASFSFFPGKNLGAYGDAGAVVSRDPEICTRVRRLRDHGRDRKEKFDHGMVGRNSRLDTLQAAVLNVKLPHLDAWNTRRRAIAARYTERLAGVVSTPVEIPGSESVYHLYVIQLPPPVDREALRSELRARGIATGLHYPRPVHLHGGMRQALGLSPGAFPVAEAVAGRILSLPIYPEMSDAQVEAVCDALVDCLRGRS